MPPSTIRAASAGRPQAELVPRAAWFRGLRYLGQLHRTYLVCEGPQGLVWSTSMRPTSASTTSGCARGAEAAGVQPLLVPQIVQLPAAAAARVAEAAEMLASIGVELDPMVEPRRR